MFVGFQSLRRVLVGIVIQLSPGGQPASAIATVPPKEETNWSTLSCSEPLGLLRFHFQITLLLQPAAATDVGGLAG